MAFNFFYYSIAVFIVILTILLVFLIKHYAITPLTSTEIILSMCLPAIAGVIAFMPSCVLLCNTQNQVGMAAKYLAVPTLNMDPTAKVNRDESKDRDEMPVTVYKLFHPEHILIKQDKVPNDIDQKEYYIYKKDDYICQKCNLNRNCLYYQCEVTLDKFCARCILDFM